VAFINERIVGMRHALMSYWNINVAGAQREQEAAAASPHDDPYGRPDLPAWRWFGTMRLPFQNT